MRYRLAITMGDPSGVGAEIIVKALSDPEVYRRCIPVVIGDREPLESALRICGVNICLKQILDPQEAEGIPGIIEYLDAGLLRSGDWRYGQVSAAAGEASFQYIVRAVSMALAGDVHGIVTAPINKEAVNLAGHHYSGHTEILAHYTDTKKFGMLLIAPRLRVIHVTTHISMIDACRLIDRDRGRVEDTIYLAQEAMQMLGIERPRIAVAGLNAHCSENGLFGTEEKTSIIPAVENCRANGVDAEGPVPPDTVFVKAMGGQYDIVVAMYHDQGHIPLKLSGFRMDEKTGRFVSLAGVNATVGLPIIRTSVDHGTAFDIAGTGAADAGSMKDAIFTAMQMASVKYKTNRLTN